MANWETRTIPFVISRAGDPGYWPAPGYFGQEDLLDTAPGEGAGGPFDDAHALVLSGGSGVGDIVNWSNDRMLGDVQAWVDGSMDNFGWILIGEEWITDEQQVMRPDNGKLANASSKIDFFSSETAAPYYAPPSLTVTYNVVPEPSSIVLLVTASACAGGACAGTRVRSRLPSLPDAFRRKPSTTGPQYLAVTAKQSVRQIVVDRQRSGRRMHEFLNPFTAPGREPLIGFA